MRWRHEERSQDSILRHPADSDAWKSFDILHPGFSREPRNVRLGLASDGINPFGNMSVSYSTWPVIVNELQELWHYGVETFDASKKENFCMHAALLWTINDFPAYSNLSGWSTKGAMACPSCIEETPSTRLKYGRKFSYMGAHRFLPMNHKWRENKSSFDGKLEKRFAPKKMSGDDVFNQLQMLQHVIFDIEGKTKDNLNACRDLKEMGIRKDLHPTQKDGKWFYLAACYTLSSEEKTKICKFLKSVKVPVGYSSNISRCVSVKECKINGLRSHDSHILLEKILPMAIRGVVPNNVYDAITELSIFRELCSKVLKKEALERLESQIVITLCKLERIFPLAFFDVMVHLIVHLATEAKIAGLVQYRWMYPIER
ncbi:uncharacterized protein LOC116132409 [Pistacia vera]|uniref:uncharacterized protein LOC116132409 n=1 Tax=Pistacia vera TaxID=55513 RepID=UPI001263234E|nr:uncharacterized protein LOC116132409 [Pistacia vera]